VPADLSSPPDLTPPAPGPQDAPSFRIDPAHTAGQPYETLKPPLALAWSVDLGGSVNYAVVGGGRVFVSSGGWSAAGELIAVDAVTGKTEWGPLALGNGLLAAYEAGGVYVLTSDGLVYALDAATGMQRWSTKLTGQLDFWAPPVAAGGSVYVNGLESGGTTYAVDESNGAVRWTNGTFDGSEGAVAIAGDVVFEAEACDNTVAWSAATGAKVWSYMGGCTGGGGAAPAVYAGKVYVRDWASSPAIFDQATGKLLGSFSASQPPAFDNGLAFYFNQGTLRQVSVASSTIGWSFAGDGMLASSPVAANGFVFIGSSSGNLYALDEKSGMTVWTVKSSGPVQAGGETSSMSIGGGALLVPVGTKLEAYR
jgi:outer membrane protein assembly factor BamB